MKKYLLGLIAFGLLNACSTSKKVAESQVEEVKEAVEEVVETEYRELDTLVVDSEMVMEEEEEKEPYRATYSRDIDILHTILDVNFNWEEEKVIGKATMDIKPIFFPVQKVRLDAKGFQINEIKLLPSQVILDYEYDSTNLWITLNKTYTKEEQFTLFIDYVASPNAQGGSDAITSDKGLFFINPRGEEADKPQQIWTQGETENNSKWFPTVDRPNERTTQEMFITVEDKFGTLSNGILKDSKDNSDGTRTDHWVMDLPHAPYLFMIAVGDFAVVTEEWKGKEVIYMVEHDYKDDAKEIFNHTPEMLTFFSELTGVDYPWSKYGQVVVRDYVSGAMENTTGVIFGEFVQRHKQDLLDEDNDYIVAHEMFHHWFGDYVTCESWSNLTLNEGFANYSEYLWKEYKYGRDKADLHLIEEFAGYLGSVAGGEIHPLIDFHYHDKEDMFDAHSYNKGGMVLHMLRNYLGDEAFFAGLKTYLEDNAFEAVEVHNLRLAFEKVTGMDMNWFFNQWFLESGHPQLEVTHHFDSDKKVIDLQIVQTQSLPDVPNVFKLPAQVGIYDQDGKELLVDILISEREQSFEIPVSFVPSVINFDPHNVLLIEEREDLDIEDYENLVKHSPSIIERIEALSIIDKEVGLGEDIIESLKDDPSPLLRSQALINFPTEKVILNKDQIIKGLNSTESPDLKVATLIALSKAEVPEVVTIASDILSKNEDSYMTIGAAIGALSKADPSQLNQYTDKLEGIKSGSIINALAAHYVKNDIPNDDYIINSVGNITGQQVWSFTETLQSFLENQDIPKQKDLMGKLASIAGESVDPWKRLLYGQVLAGLVNKYANSSNPDYSKELRGSMMKLIEKEPMDQLKGIFMQFLQ